MNCPPRREKRKTCEMTAPCLLRPIAVAAVVLAAAAGAFWTTSAVKSSWYEQRRPPSSPPDWVFGAVWSLIYAGLAFVGAEGPRSSLFLVAFFVNLALNAAWTYVFFRLRRPGPSLAIILALTGTTAGMLVLDEGLSAFSRGVLGAYLAWTLFAAVLNAEASKADEEILHRLQTSARKEDDDERRYDEEEALSLQET